VHVSLVSLLLLCSNEFSCSDRALLVFVASLRVWMRKLTQLRMRHALFVQMKLKGLS